MASATVTIKAGLTTGDVLGFTNTATITGSYNPITGVLTLSGPDTKAAYEAALESVTYHSTSDDPTASSTSRTIEWKVTDAGAVTSVAGTSTISVTAVNDAPVAAADSLAATEDTPVTYTAAQLLGNDSDVDGDTLTIASVTSGTGGTATLNGDGTVTFTPNANFNGPADFSYTVTDGALASNTATVSVAVAAVNDAPVAAADSLAATEDTPVTYTAAQLLGNDSDVDGDTLTIASVTSGTGGTATLNGDGTVTFTPNANFNGPADFSYTVTDGSLTSNTATVTVAVAAVNDAPEAAADSLAATEDTPVTYTAAQLLGNDSDVDGDTLTDRQRHQRHGRHG